MNKTKIIKAILENNGFVVGEVKKEHIEIWETARYYLLSELWHTTSDFGQQKRYELIYDKIVKEMNDKLSNSLEVSQEILRKYGR